MACMAEQRTDEVHQTRQLHHQPSAAVAVLRGKAAAASNTVQIEERSKPGNASVPA